MHAPSAVATFYVASGMVYTAMPVMVWVLLRRVSELMNSLLPHRNSNQNSLPRVVRNSLQRRNAS